MMKFEKVVFFLVTIQCLLIPIGSTEDFTATASPSPEPATPSHLKCSRDYHCPSKCDVCLSGICTHQLNLNCTRDYHCPACEVCRSGKCIEGERIKKCETDKDCDGGGWCLAFKCVENKCEKDSDCGTDKVQCKLEKCEHI